MYLLTYLLQKIWTRLLVRGIGWSYYILTNLKCAFWGSEVRKGTVIVSPCPAVRVSVDKTDPPLPEKRKPFYSKTISKYSFSNSNSSFIVGRYRSRNELYSLKYCTVIENGDETTKKWFFLMFRGPHISTLCFF